MSMTACSTAKTEHLNQLKSVWPWWYISMVTDNVSQCTTVPSTTSWSLHWSNPSAVRLSYCWLSLESATNKC